MSAVPDIVADCGAVYSYCSPIVRPESRRHVVDDDDDAVAPAVGDGAWRENDVSWY